MASSRATSGVLFSQHATSSIDAPKFFGGSKAKGGQEKTTSELERENFEIKKEHSELKRLKAEVGGSGRIGAATDEQSARLAVNTAARVDFFRHLGEEEIVSGKEYRFQVAASNADLLQQRNPPQGCSSRSSKPISGGDVKAIQPAVAPAPPSLAATAAVIQSAEAKRTKLGPRGERRSRRGNPETKNTSKTTHRSAPPALALGATAADLKPPQAAGGRWGSTSTMLTVPATSDFKRPKTAEVAEVFNRGRLGFPIRGRATQCSWLAEAMMDVLQQPGSAKQVLAARKARIVEIYQEFLADEMAPYVKFSMGIPGLLRALGEVVPDPRRRSSLCAAACGPLRNAPPSPPSSWEQAAPQALAEGERLLYAVRTKDDPPNKRPKEAYSKANRRAYVKELSAQALISLDLARVFFLKRSAKLASTEISLQKSATEAATDKAENTTLLATQLETKEEDNQIVAVDETTQKAAAGSCIPCELPQLQAPSLSSPALCPLELAALTEANLMRLDNCGCEKRKKDWWRSANRAKIEEEVLRSEWKRAGAYLMAVKEEMDALHREAHVAAAATAPPEQQQQQQSARHQEDREASSACWEKKAARELQEDVSQTKAPSRAKRAAAAPTDTPAPAMERVITVAPPSCAPGETAAVAPVSPSEDDEKEKKRIEEDEEKKRTMDEKREDSVQTKARDDLRQTLLERQGQKPSPQLTAVAAQESEKILQMEEQRRKSQGEEETKRKLEEEARRKQGEKGQKQAERQRADVKAEEEKTKKQVMAFDSNIHLKTLASPSCATDDWGAVIPYVSSRDGAALVLPSSTSSEHDHDGRLEVPHESPGDALVMLPSSSDREDNRLVPSSVSQEDSADVAPPAPPYKVFLDHQVLPHLVGDVPFSLLCEFLEEYCDRLECNSDDEERLRNIAAIPPRQRPRTNAALAAPITSVAPRSLKRRVLLPQRRVEASITMMIPPKMSNRNSEEQKDSSCHVKQLRASQVEQPPFDGRTFYGLGCSRDKASALPRARTPRSSSDAGGQSGGPASPGKTEAKKELMAATNDQGHQSRSLNLPSHKSVKEDVSVKRKKHRVLRAQRKRTLKVANTKLRGRTRIWQHGGFPLKRKRVPLPVTTIESRKRKATEMEFEGGSAIKADGVAATPFVKNGEAKPSTTTTPEKTRTEKDKPCAPELGEGHEAAHKKEYSSITQLRQVAKQQQVSPLHEGVMTRSHRRKMEVLKSMACQQHPSPLPGPGSRDAIRATRTTTTGVENTLKRQPLLKRRRGEPGTAANSITPSSNLSSASGSVYTPSTGGHRRRKCHYRRLNRRGKARPGKV